MDRRPSPTFNYGRDTLLLELPSHIILIESKTTDFSRNIITPKTILHDNSTRMIKRAIKQVHQTAQDVRDGVFRPLGVSSGKPVWAIVSTFGEIPSVNAPWYFEKYLNASTLASVSECPPITGRPIILSLRYLELLATIMRASGRTLPELFAEREDLGYGTTGDWDAYLEQTAGEVNQEHLLPYVQADFDSFFRTLGVDRQVQDVGVGIDPG